jgi:23S rRNA (uracil1939-C5)-methyltransferase
MKSSQPICVNIDGLSHDGRGIAHHEGKALFVWGALPGEQVIVQPYRRQRRYDEAELVDIVQASSQRITPHCPHFGQCGGCALQHLAPETQLVYKQQIVQDALLRIGKVTPQTWLPPITGPIWGYRYKARLGVRDVIKKQCVLVGFRERRSSFITAMEGCPVLHADVGERITALADCIAGLSIRQHVAQIEMARGDHDTVLILRFLQPPTASDLKQLLAFAEVTGLHLYGQEGDLSTVHPLSGQDVTLSYRLPTQQIEIQFAPTDFTQVNPQLNQSLVTQALTQLALTPQDHVLDLFCGLGNFSLPCARYAHTVYGIEGDAGLVARATANAQRHDLKNVQFECADLYAPSDQQAAWRIGHFNKVLLDPPRSGAWEIIPHLTSSGVERIVYVSCYPSTLARDAERLVHDCGYQLQSVGVFDMFPHTAHVESMAVFVRTA